MKTKAILSVLIVSLGLSGCADMSHEDKGVLTGAVIGGLVGSRFGGGAGQVIATGAGAMIGAYLGGQIGQSMDKQDQMHLNRALETTKTGQVEQWKNPDSGNRYRVEPTKTYYQKGHPCRDFTTIATINGTQQQLHGRACRDERGRWRMK